MKVHKQEIDIKDLIEAQAKTCVAANISALNSTADSIISKNPNIKYTFANEKILHPDLLYGSAILASTVMNKNDDVFLPQETWEAKKTPINTPFDNQHEEKFIIGHIISSYVLDENGAIYNLDTVPDYFDIGVDFVLYKERFPSLALEIQELGPDKKLFVSMEAIMSDFDYALVDAQGNVKIVKRNEDTAFLTKSLRIFGGTGKYGSYRVGRVLRNFRFTGMANVDSPANPKSIYTSIADDKSVSKEKITQAAANILNKFDNFIFTTKGNVMMIENLEQAKQVIADLETKLAEASKTEASVKDINTKLNEALASLSKEQEKSVAFTQHMTECEKASKDLNDKIFAAAEDKKTVESKLDLATKSAEQLKVELESTNKSLAEKVAANDYLQKALDEYKKASIKNERSAVLANLGFEVSAEEAEKYASMSEDSFKEIVSFAEKMKKKDAKDKEDKKDEEDPKDKKEKDKKDAEATLATASAIDENTIENINVETKTKAEEMKSLAEELVATMFKGKKNKSKINKNKE